MTPDGPILFRWFEPAADGVKDDLPKLQEAVDAAFRSPSRTLIIDDGYYLLDGTLRIQPANGLGAVHIKGSPGSTPGTVRLIHATGQMLNPMFNVQGGRHVVLSDLRLIGNNKAPATQYADGWTNPEKDAWVTPGCSERQYAPYAGVCIDGLTGNDPGAGNGYTFGPYNQPTSSRLWFERCRIEGFVAGVAVNPSQGTTGSEDIVISGTHLLENTYDIVTCGSQQRCVIFKDGDLYGSYRGVDNNTFGTLNGCPVHLDNVNIGKVHEIGAVNSETSVFGWTRLYAENVSRIGIGKTQSSADHPFRVSDSNLSTIGVGPAGQKVDAVSVYTGPAQFSSVSFADPYNHLVIAHKGARFENAAFRCNNEHRAGAFLIATPQGMEHTLDLVNCRQRASGAVLNTLINRHETIQTLPPRIDMGRTVHTITTQVDRKQYRVDPMQSHVNAKIAKAPGCDSYLQPDGTIRMVETTAPYKLLHIGAILYWRVKYDAAPILLPAAYVSGHDGDTLICTVTAEIVEDYDPANVDIYIPQFATAQEITGTITRNSPDIAVSDASQLHVHDWLRFDDPVFASPVRIVGIAGNIVTVHRPMNTPTPDPVDGVGVFNSRLIT